MVNILYISSGYFIVFNHSYDYTLGRGLDSLLTSLNSAHIGSDLTPLGLDNHLTEMQWDSVIYLRYIFNKI